MTSHSIYQYEKLLDPTRDIRLATLLPGEGDNPITLRITNTALERYEILQESDQRLDDARKTLPSGWDAYQTLDSRILFVHKDAVESTVTSWKHPNASTGASTEVAKTASGEEFPGQGADYEVLSYTWGVEESLTEALADLALDDSQENVANSLVEILADSLKYATLSVGQSLEESLRYLRSKHTKRVLWIETLCINQVDSEEKNAQVARIEDIFKMAKRVIVSVGPSKDDSHLAIGTLEYIGKQVVSTADRHRVPAPDAVENTWYKSSTRLPFDDKTLKAISTLLQRS